MATEIQADILVIGGGIAGAFAAYKARQSGARVLLVDRSFFGRSGCSALASGVYPAYMPGDNVSDWVKGLGAGPLVNQSLFVKSLPVSYEHLMTMDRWGVRWLKEGKEIVRMGAPGRSFKNGAWMAEGGPQMMMAVRAGVLESGVQVLNRVAVTELLTSGGRVPTEGRVVGAIGFHVRTGEIYAIQAKATIMCTGPYKFPYPWPGSKLGYMPIDLSGDGIAMMLNAGAQLSRLELGGINLNPDHMLCAPGLESLMPSGAKYIDKHGRRFLEDYDPKRMEMTSRALLYFAIAHQKELGNIPSMDLREITPERVELLKKVIPIVIANFEGSGLDVTSEPVPYTYQVAGTAGIFGAGARITEQGETTIPGLYAAGTCSDIAYLPGGHLTFCSVTGHWAGETAAAYAATAPIPPLVAGQLERAVGDLTAPLRRSDGLTYEGVHRRLGELLMDKVGLVLHAERLRSALDQLLEIRRHEVSRLKAIDFHQLAKVWGLMHYTRVLEATLRAYLYRKESRVAFIREDYPIIDNVNWVKMVVVQRQGESLKLWDEPLPESFHLDPVRPTQNLHLVFRHAEIPHAIR
ncbi:MAG: FAD-binding protein [Deltaproteobacteria bacterium]|nr:FAD-binding protein [Deltaproteobacteria bacterium]